MTRAARVAALLLPALAAAGCFDVHTVDPGALVIDDFDDGDFLPADVKFGHWICYSFNPEGIQGYKCDHDSGFESAYSMSLDATVVDPPDGTQQHGGASLASYATASEDWTRLSEIVLNVKLESGNPPLPSNALLYVELGCGTAETKNGDRPGNLYVLQTLDYKSYWQTMMLDLNSFNAPSWQATAIKGGPAGCLARVDSVRISVDAQLPDGDTGELILHVDDIHLD